MMLRIWRDWRVAAGLSALWVLLVAVYVFGYLTGGDAVPHVSVFSGVVLGMAALLPLVLIWSVAALARLLEGQDARFDRIEAGMETLYAEFQAVKGGDAGAAPTGLSERLEEVSGGLDRRLARLETVLAGLEALRAELEDRDRPAPAAPTPEAGPEAAHPVAAAEPVAEPAPAPPLPEPSSAPAAPTPVAQPTLPLDAPAADREISAAELIRALDFPRDANDAAGFAALKRALRSRDIAQLLQAAEDVMNMLAESGIYMDDLSPEPASPALWRRFAQGERGGGVAAVGGIQDDEAEATVLARTRSDPVFRDTSLHFQRRFDVVLAGFARSEGDSELAALADTRTARAFQLLARVSGSFADRKTAQPPAATARLESSDETAEADDAADTATTTDADTA